MLEGMQSKNRRRFQYLLFYKPYGVLCQFSDTGGRETLANYGSFPKGVYPAGRLDRDSEGLVFLTDDGELKHLLLDPVNRHPRTYMVQVENIPSEKSLDRLRSGVVIEGRTTLPAEVEILSNEPWLPPRPVPIRVRKNIPTAWLQIIIHEGRNRQVRKMTAAIGHPTLRLVRMQIANLSLEGLNPGEQRALSAREVKELRGILFG